MSALARFILYENRLIEQGNVSVAALRVTEISGLNLEKMQGRAFFPHRQKTVRIITRCPY